MRFIIILFSSIFAYLTPYSINPTNLTNFRTFSISPSASLPSCQLPIGSGLKMGVCGSAPELPFCGEFIDFNICQPPVQSLWPEWTAIAKDAVLAEQFSKVVETRISEEKALAKAADGPEPQEEFITVRFAQNQDCVLAFKRALCWANFPRCGESGKSYPVCQTSCENYFKSCRFNSNPCGSNPLWPLSGGSDISSNSTACTGGVKDWQGIGGIGAAGILAAFLISNS